MRPRTRAETRARRTPLTANHTASDHTAGPRPPGRDGGAGGAIGAFGAAGSARATGADGAIAAVGAAMGAAGATLRTNDGVPIDACHDAGPSEIGFVVAHGFTGSWRRPALRRVAALLTGAGGVISFDFRGHGRSGGVSTVGDREVLDVEAAVGWATSLGYARVVTLGFSMGASVVVRHAALCGGVAAVAAVSGPSRWYYRGTPPMRRVHWAIERRLGRLVSRLALGTRVSSLPWDPQPEAPHELAARISPVPLLVVHGDTDRYFPVEHGHALYAAAKEPKQLWIEAGFGHAENAASDELIGRIGDWLASHARLAREP